MSTNWHPIFETGKIEEVYTERELCAIGLYGYADFMETEDSKEIPDKFDLGFTEICLALGIAATKESIYEYSLKLKNKP